MKNPLIKRIPRELKTDWSKYMVIFLFLAMLISLVSGFLISDKSALATYDEGMTKYNVEDGHLAFTHKPEAALLSRLEKEAGLTLHDLSYVEEPTGDASATIRIYKQRTTVNLSCLMSGSYPVASNEIALDRMYAQNAGISVGDTIELNQRTLTVSGLIALVDYSCLFENNSDMMFDSVHFSVAIMTEEGFETLQSNHLTYNYAWKYNNGYEKEDDTRAKELSDSFLKVLEKTLTDYNTERFMAAAESGMTLEEFQDNELITLSDYLPRYLNQAINFTGEDMGGDKTMFLIFDYIVTVVIAFVFAVTTSNTITAEAGVIGTLRASGYSRGQILRHYLVLPVAVTLFAAIVGNLLGYTVMEPIFIKMYYDSYSLATYQTLPSSEAFIATTVVPIILMFLINFWILTTKLRLSPLRFLRRDLSKRGKKKAFRLNTKIPFLHRFRLRILFQNLPNYLTLCFGIFLGGCVVIFSLMFTPLLDDYAEKINKTKLCEYQYILIKQVETTDSSAEKYSVTSLKTSSRNYLEDEIMIYGIVPNSRYVTSSIPAGKALISNGMAAKYKLSKGDSVTLKDPYSSSTYTFEIADIYTYDAALSLFLNLDDYHQYFQKSEDEFTGYFSQDKLEDIDSKYIAKTITTEDLTKVSNQLKISIGQYISYMKGFGIILFLLLMYLLSKQIIEKNAHSISMTKILGFSAAEIGGLYIVATSIVVLLALLLTIPLVDLTLRFVFTDVLYTSISGYIPYMIAKNCYVQMIVYGIVSYALVAVLQFFKINRIPKADALKNME